jgi:hypothetical protein
MVVLAATDFMRHFDPLLNIIHGKSSSKMTSYRFYYSVFHTAALLDYKGLRWLPWTLLERSRIGHQPMCFQLFLISSFPNYCNKQYFGTRLAICQPLSKQKGHRFCIYRLELILIRFFGGVTRQRNCSR